MRQINLFLIKMLINLQHFIVFLCVYSQIVRWRIEIARMETMMTMIIMIRKMTKMEMMRVWVTGYVNHNYVNVRSRNSQAKNVVLIKCI